MSERLGPETLDQVLSSTMARHGRAGLMAIGEDGLFVPMPASVPVGDRQVFEGRWALDLVPPADRVAVIETWERAREEGAAVVHVHLGGDQPVRVEFVFVDARHTHGTYLGIVVPLDDAGGESPLPAPPPMPVRVAKIHKDDLSMVMGIDSAATQILGWEPDEMVGRRSLEFIHPDDHERAIANWLEMLGDPDTPRPVRLRHQRRDGSWLWVEITNHFQTGDPERPVMADVIDITEEMDAQEALRAREQLLDRLAQTVPLGLVQIDAEGGVIYANERLGTIVGTTEGARLVDRFARLLGEDRERLDRALADVLGPGHNADVELRLDLGAEAGLRQCALSMRPLTGADGAVSGAIASVVDVTESVRLRRELEQRALTDPLTGCHNRASVMAHLSAVLDGPDHAARGTAVVFVDLDRFKPVNDRLGHASGDRLLEVAAARLRDVVRRGDVVGRLGGDEFLVVCPSVSEAGEALDVAARVATALHREVALPAGMVDMRASIGVAWTGQEDVDAGELVARADTAMYESKRQGAGRPVLYGRSLHPVASSGLDDERWLRETLAGDLMEVHYQPIVDLADGRTIGYESLVRGPRDGRLVAAGLFIDVAERTGLIHDIGALVLGTTLAQAARQAGQGEALRWAVNASPLEIAAPGLPEAVERELSRHGVDPGSLVIEVTEHSALGDGDQARTALHELNELGVTLALDDFGTGWSSLSLLHTVPFSVLKIDRSFVSPIAEDANTRQLVDAVIEMARRLNLDTVIEGVETEEQRALLLELGATNAQGWLFSPARPATELFTATGSHPG